MTEEQTPKSVNVAQQYDMLRPAYDRLQSVVESTLGDLIGKEGVKIHSIAGRVKERESFLKKVNDKTYSDVFNQMPDIVGARVICLFVEDLKRLDQVMRNNFEILSSDDKTATSDESSFGYSSVHYDCRILPSYQGPYYDGLHTFRFEVQCRTMLMDAWANVSHYLAYKGRASVPSDMQRDLNAMSALFHIADKQFQELATRASASDNNAFFALKVAGEKSANESLPIDRSSVKALLQTQFPNREQSGDSEYSIFADQVTEAGYKNLSEVYDAIRQGLPAALQSEIDTPPSSIEVPDEPTTYTDIGISRTALSIINPTFKHLSKSVWYRREE